MLMNQLAEVGFLMTTQAFQTIMVRMGIMKSGRNRLVEILIPIHKVSMLMIQVSKAQHPGLFGCGCFLPFYVWYYYSCS